MDHRTAAKKSNKSGGILGLFRDRIKRPKFASASQPNSARFVPGSDEESTEPQATVSDSIQSGSAVDQGRRDDETRRTTSTPCSSTSLDPTPGISENRSSTFPDGNRQVQDSNSGLTPKEILVVTWTGIEMLLKKVEGCLAGTSAKAPIAAINAIIDIKNVVKDNEGVIDGLIIETAKRLLAVNRTLDKGFPDCVKPRMAAFSEILRDEIRNLKEIGSKGTFIRILKNEADKSDIQGIFKRIDEATKTFQIDMALATEKTANEILSEIKLRKLERMLAWKAIYNADLGTGATMTREPCTDGTREEILKDIIAWADAISADSPPVFWLTGQAGSGKTTIAYTITKYFDQLEKKEPTGRRTVLVGSFFCSRQFEETRRQIHIIPTLVYQLTQKSRSYADALQEANKFNSVDKLTEQMEDLFVDPWRKSEPQRHTELPPYLIVVDALDEIEAEGGSRFLQDILKTIDRHPLRGLKFLVTSRPDPRVVELCKSFSSDAICRLQDVPIEHVESDITKYLQVKLPNFAGKPELKTMTQLADGLFISAATIVRYLTPRPSVTADEQRKLLSKLHVQQSFSASGTRRSLLIDELYQQILRDAFSDLDDDLFNSRLRILHTFLCTFERTSTSLAAALLSEPDETAIAVLNELHAVLYRRDELVLWYHASFPDFIFNQTRSTFELDGRLISMSIKPHHHALLTKYCFDFMLKLLRFNIGDIPSSFALDADDPELVKRIDNNINTVLRYSSRYWARHLTLTDETEADDKSDICDRIIDFLRIHILFWIEAMNLLRSSSQCATLLQSARGWVLKNANGQSELAANIAEAANFSTYFAANPPAKATPHLYISSLATWSTGLTLSQRWKEQFPHIPSFVHRKAADVPLMSIQTGRGNRSVAFSADGMRIASGSDYGFVRVWDASTGAELKVLNGHTSPVRSVAFSADGMRIVSGSEDKSVRVWDALTGAELKVLSGHTNLVHSVAFSSDSTRIVSGSYGCSVRVWDTSTWAELTQWVLHGQTNHVPPVAFSADGKCVASGSDDNSVRVWDASTGAELKVLNGHTEIVSCVAFSADATRIVSGSYDKSVRVWDASTGDELKVLNGHPKIVLCVAFSIDGTRIASGAFDMSVRVWDASTGDQLKVLNGHIHAVFFATFSADSTRIATGSYDNSLGVWDASAGVELKVPHGHTEPVHSVSFSADGTRIVSGSYDNSVRVWDASTGAQLMVLDGPVSCVAFSADGTRIVSGASNSSVLVWEASTGAKLTVLDGHTSEISCVAFSPDGTRIVSCSEDESVWVWDASTGAKLMVLLGHTDSVHSAAFSVDGTRIISGSYDSSMRVWDASTGEPLRVLNTPGRLFTFSADGTRIVYGSYADSSVVVWDASTETELIVLLGHTDSVHSVAFSVDGTRIVSGSYDRSVRVWDASTGAELRVINGHASYITSVVFSPDSTRVVSGSDDSSVRVWDASTEVKPVVTNLIDSSMASPVDNTCITVDEESARLYIVGRAYPAWTNDAQTGWIHAVAGGYHLMWVPERAHPYSTAIMSWEGSAFVNFQDCKIGPDWASCYIPS